MPSSVVIVIPCFNEQQRLPVEEIRKFLTREKQNHVEILLVNDGSSDGTLAILQNLAAEWDEVSILDLPENVGKAEAIRQGMLSLNSATHDFFSYMDADLATPIEEINHLLKYATSNYKLIMGSRIKLLGFSEIKRSSRRHYLGRIFATFASMALNIPVYDTQCGAKLIRREDVARVFQQPFISKWLFDIELIFRMKKQYPELNPEDYILEVPLKSWKDVGGSKIKATTFLKAPFELMRIYLKYQK